MRRSGRSYMDHKDLQVPQPTAPPPVLEAPTSADGGFGHTAGGLGSGGGGGGCVTTDGLVTFNGAVVDVRSLQAQLVRAHRSHMQHPLLHAGAARVWISSCLLTSSKRSWPAEEQMCVADKHMLLAGACACRPLGELCTV